MSWILNCIIAIAVALIAASFASLCILSLYREEQKHKEDPLLPIGYEEGWYDAE